MIAITLDQPERGNQPGDALSGVVQWQFAAPPTALLIQLLYFTRGKGTQDIRLVNSIRIDSPAAAGEREFSFTLPDRPYSFSGKLVSLTWAVEALVEPKGEAQRAEFALSPSGREIDLIGAGEPATK